MIGDKTIRTYSCGCEHRGDGTYVTCEGHKRTSKVQLQRRAVDYGDSGYGDFKVVSGYPREDHGPALPAQPKHYRVGRIGMLLSSGFTLADKADCPKFEPGMQLYFAIEEGGGCQRLGTATVQEVCRTDGYIRTELNQSRAIPGLAEGDYVFRVPFAEPRFKVGDRVRWFEASEVFPALGTVVSLGVAGTGVRVRWDDTPEEPVYAFDGQVKHAPRYEQCGCVWEGLTVMGEREYGGHWCDQHVNGAHCRFYDVLHGITAGLRALHSNEPVTTAEPDPVCDDCGKGPARDTWGNLRGEFCKHALCAYCWHRSDTLALHPVEHGPGITPPPAACVDEDGDAWATATWENG